MLDLKKYKTPFYFYDLATVERNFKNLQDALGPKFQIYYSMKANPHVKILAKMLGLGARLDISSNGELQKGLAAGFSPKDLSFVGPGKSELELKQIIENEVEYCVVESFRELEMLSRLTGDRRQKFCVRINPESYIQNTGTVRNSVASQFGIDEAQLFDEKTTLPKNLQFAGLHFYLHAQFFNFENIIQNFSKFADIAVRAQKRFSTKFEWINFGGGFGVPYFQNQNALDLAILKKSCQEFLKSDSLKELAGTQFCVESGRFLTSSAGIFVTKVLYKKVSYGKTIYVCDGGLSNHQAATGVGQVIRRNFPIRFYSDAQTRVGETADIVGPSCYSIDALARDIEMDSLEPDDLVIVEQSGAYGPSFSPQAFLSREPASEYTDED